MINECVDVCVYAADTWQNFRDKDGSSEFLLLLRGVIVMEK